VGGLEIQTRKRMIFAAGHSHPELAGEIADILGTGLAEVEIDHFANGEIYMRFAQNVRGCDVFIFQTHFEPINDNIMEQLIMIDAAKRASAKRITALVPYYGYSRQDRKARGREPISARLLADLFTTAGADRVLSVDLHSAQIQGFFNMPFDHLTAVPLLAAHLEEKFDGDLTVVSPDVGRVKVAERLANRLHAQMAILDKHRSTDERNAASTTKAVIGVENVVGRRCVLVDDMIDTAGTITGAAEVRLEFGADEVYACATHAILSDPATDRLKNSPIKEVIVTNTVPIPPERMIDKISVLSIAPVVAKTVRAVFQDESVSEIFEGEN
jgi:ribose-phosphate pyrophosphokinase